MYRIASERMTTGKESGEAETSNAERKRRSDREETTEKDARKIAPDDGTQGSRSHTQMTRKWIRPGHAKIKTI